MLPSRFNQLTTENCVAEMAHKERARLRRKIFLQFSSLLYRCERLLFVLTHLQFIRQFPVLSLTRRATATTKRNM